VDTCISLVSLYNILNLGECGQTMQTRQCPECGIAIGGQNHRAAAGQEVVRDLRDII
jgi:hypothetical protein